MVEDLPLEVRNPDVTGLCPWCSARPGAEHSCGLGGRWGMVVVGAVREATAHSGPFVDRR